MKKLPSCRKHYRFDIDYVWRKNTLGNASRSVRPNLSAKEIEML